VKHATQHTLAKYSTFIDSLRSIEEIVEKSPGVFYRKSKPFLHFHEDPTGLYADLRVNADEEFTRVRVATKVEQTTFLKMVSTALTTPVHK
jgi:hypothetical protein